MRQTKAKECESDYLAPLLEDDTLLHSERGVTGWSIGGFFSKILPYGGLASATFNLASATLGAAVMSVPSAFNFCGLVVALIILLGVTLSTVYSIRLLIEAGEITNLSSYEALARALFGPGWDYFIACVMLLLTFGCCVACIISINDLLIPFAHADYLPNFFQTKSGERILTSLVWLIGIFPICLPKHINSLRYASVFAVFCILFFILCIVVHALQNGFKGGKLRNDIRLWRADNATVEGLSIFVFAYLCQVNCFEISAEMVEPSVRKMTIASSVSMFLCFIGYVVAGFFGYADFGAEVTDSILTVYDIRSDVLLAVGFGGVAVKLCVGFALCLLPARDACYYLLGLKLETVPTWKHNLFCGTISLLALITGLFIPTVNTVFGLIGSLCGGLLGFCLPAIYRMYCGNWGIKQVGVVNYVCTYLMLIAGVIAIVFGTGAAIYGIFT